MPSFTSVVAWCVALASTIQAQSSRASSQPVSSSRDIECFDFDGTSRFDRNQQCPDSQTCCQTRNLCLPNKMCLGDGELIRPPCAIYPWSNSTCSPLCPFVTGNGVLPRIQMCADGSYCCNDDALCCSKGAGKFVGPNGNLISNPYNTNASTTSPPNPTIPAAVTVAATTVTATALGSGSGSVSGSNGLSTGAKGAIGALAGVLLLTIIATGFFVRRKRRQFSNLKSTSTKTQPVAHQSGHSFFAPTTEMGSGRTQRAELGADGKMGYAPSNSTIAPTRPELSSEPSSTQMP